MSNRSVYVVGFPNSGKTTYLAALWHLLNSAAVNLSLNLHRLSGERSYLNEIAERWRQCHPVDRTPTTMRENIEILLKSIELDQVLKLQIPDLSGETFMDVFSTRSLQAVDESSLEECTGILMFVSVERPITGVRIDALGTEFDTEAGNTQSSEDVVPWSVDMVQEQVRLVDFLQTSRSIIPGNKKIKIAVIVSAWDLVQEQNMLPRTWLRQELPLFDQYLKNSQDSSTVDVFGVSAQGASFDDTLSDEFIALSPNDRILVQHDRCRSSDLTKPLSWLLERA